MATKEQYLNALLNAKNNAIQNNSVLVNPSNTTTQLSPTSEQEILPQTANQNSEAKWYEKVFGFIDDVAREFGSGFVRGWEGIGDFILTGVSAIGEATGNDMSELNDYIKLDLGGLAGQWTQSYMNFTPWGIVKNIKNYGDSEYWNNFAQDTIANLDLAFGGLGGHNQSDIDKVIENNRKYAINNASTLTDMGETGEFIGGVAGSIGQLLPSVMIGNAVGSVASAGKGVQSLSKLGQNVVKGIQLGAFGLGAGGQGSQEALNEGASSKQALAYGTMVGAIEVGTELASAGLGKFGAKIVGSNTKLGKVLANSKFGGFDILKKSVGTASIGQLAKDMVEEGLEEVASEILSPLAKSIYKGSSALDEYGTDEYWKQVGLSFASGAVMSGFLSGTQQVYIKNSLGNNGVKVVNNIEKLSSTQQSLLQEFENAKTEQERQEVLNKAQKSGNAELLKETIDLIDNLNEKQKVNLLKFYISPEQAIEEFKSESIANYGENSIDKKLENKIIDSYYKSDKAKNRFISSLNTNYKDFGVYVANEISQKISERTGKNLNIKISNKELHDDKGNVVHALYDGKDTIVVNKKYRSQLYGAISHEGFVHAFSNMSKDAFNQFRKYITEGEGQKIYNEIMKTKGKETIWGEKLKDTTLEEAVRETYKESSNAVIEEELLAHFMQELIKDGNRFNQILENNNGKSVIKKLINKVKSSIDKTGITSLINQYQKAIDNIDAKKTSESNNLGLVMYSLKPNIRYSKSLDSNGQKLSVEQEQYFKDSVIRDENGNLLVLYHGTDADFTIFDKKISQNAFFFSRDKLTAGSYYDYNRNNGKTMEVYLNIKNPKIIEVNNSWNKINIGKTKKVNLTNLEGLKKAIKNIKNIEQLRVIYNELTSYDFDLPKFEEIVAMGLEEGKTLKQIFKEQYNVEAMLNYLDEMEFDENELFSIGDFNEFSNLSVKTIEEIDFSNTRDVVENVLQEGKHDGIIFKNILDFNNLPKEFQKPDTVYVAFEPNQIKNVNNYTPTSNDDIRYSKALDGNKNNVRYAKQIVVDMNKQKEMRFASEFYKNAVENVMSFTLDEVNERGKKKPNTYTKHIKVGKTAQQVLEKNPKAKELIIIIEGQSVSFITIDELYDLYLENPAFKVDNVSVKGKNPLENLTRKVKVEDKKATSDKEEVKVETKKVKTEEQKAEVKKEEVKPTPRELTEEDKTKIKKSLAKVENWKEFSTPKKKLLYGAIRDVLNSKFSKSENVDVQKVIDEYISSKAFSNLQNIGDIIDKQNAEKEEQLRIAKEQKANAVEQETKKTTEKAKKEPIEKKKFVKQENVKATEKESQKETKPKYVRNIVIVPQQVKYLLNKLFEKDGKFGKRFTKESEFSKEYFIQNIYSDVLLKQDELSKKGKQSNAIELLEKSVDTFMAKEKFTETFDKIHQLEKKYGNVEFYKKDNQQTKVKETSVNDNVSKEKDSSVKQVNATKAETREVNKLKHELEQTKKEIERLRAKITERKESKKRVKVEDKFLKKGYDGTLEIFDSEDGSKYINEYNTLKHEARRIENSIINKPLESRFNKNNKEQFVLIAPLFRFNAETQAQFDYGKNIYQDKFYKRTRQTALLLGCDFGTLDSRRVYQNQDEFFQIEPSNFISLGKVDNEIANIAGSMFADIGFQQQETVIVFNYENTENWENLKNENKAFVWEFSLKEGVDQQEIAKFFSDNKISATIYGNKVMLLKSFEYDFNNSEEEANNFYKKVKEIYDLLNKEGKVYGKIKENKANARQLDRKTRKIGYSIWDRVRRLPEGNASESSIQEIQSKSQQGRVNQNNNNVSKPVPYKSIETTNQIVEEIKNNIEQKLGDDWVINLPKNKDSVVERSLSKINNNKSISVQAEKVFDIIKKSKVSVLIDGNYKDFGSLEEFVAGSEQGFINDIEQIINSKQDNYAISKQTRGFEILINKLKYKLNILKEEKKNIRLIQKERDTLKRKISGDPEINNDFVSKNGLLVLSLPIYKIKSSNGGGGFRAFEVYKSFNELLEVYNEKNFSKNFEGIPVYEELRNKIKKILDLVGTPIEQNGRKISGDLTADALKAIKEYSYGVRKVINDVKAKNDLEYRPMIVQTYQTISNMNRNNKKFTKPLRMYERAFAPAYVLLDEITGSISSLRNILVSDTQNAINEQIMYKGKKSDLINKKLKELGLKANSLSKKVLINGHKITVGQAIGLYNSLNVKANTDAIENYGMKYIDSNNSFVEFSEKNNSLKLKQEVENSLTSKEKEFGDFLLELMNGEIRQDYIDYVIDTFGKEFGVNVIGNEGDKSYWQLNRAYERYSDLEKAVRVPYSLFTNAEHRKSSDNAVVLTDALSIVLSYIDNLSSEKYIKPQYRKVKNILNGKVGKKSIYELLGEKLEREDVQYINTTMEDLLGANKNKKHSILDYLMSGYSVAMLSMNVGSMAKQFASIYSSNIPLRKSTKAIIKAIFSGEEMKKEFKTLFDEIGGLKYRESSTSIIASNTNDVGGLIDAFGKVGMWGISKMDLLTITTGVYSLMVIGEDNFNYKIGSKENIDFVKRSWHDFELSQIGRGSLSKNAIGRGDYNSDIIKSVFGFMQGANRAMLGSQLTLAGLYNRNKNVNIDTLENNKNIYKKESEVAEQEYNNLIKEQSALYEKEELTEQEETRVKELKELIDTKANEFADLKAKLIDAENKIKDFNRFKTSGGKAIPLKIASGVIAQGLLVALITELMRHIKGKKDWDEFDAKEISMNILLAIGVDWLPLVNAISSLIKGYDISVPSVEVLNGIADISNSFKDGDIKDGIREIAFTLSNSLGIPTKTIIDYLYGALKIFDAESAYKFNNILYSSSEKSLRDTIKNQYEKKDYKSVNSLIGLLMDEYKVNSSDSVKQEIANLYNDGFNAIPSSFITSYQDESGNKIEMTNSEIETFRTLYNQSNKDIEELLTLGSYKNQTQESKAKIIKRVYSSYYSFAKSFIVGEVPQTKIAKIIYYTKGQYNISKYIAINSYVSSIKANSSKTRKELVVSYINSLKGLDKQEKLLAMYLCGYSLNDGNKNSLSSYLLKLGMSKKVIDELLK